MMQFFTGKQEKQEKKIENDIADIFKVQLKKQFCQLCQKNPASKIAFGREFKPVFTCPGCQLKAVGGVVQRLGPKSLINFDKFVQILTKELMGYQTSIKNPPIEYKKPSQSCQQIKEKSADISAKIGEEFKKLKKIVLSKQDSIIEESLKQNNVLIFEEISKLQKQKKMNQIENGQLLLKRAMCNNKGLHFSDQEAIELSNQAANEKFANVKKESKIKLKPLEDLIDEINNIQLE